MSRESKAKKNKSREEKFIKQFDSNFFIFKSNIYAKCIAAYPFQKHFQDIQASEIKLRKS